ncbi:MAG TPA: ATP-binding protein, partial [Candidatus Sulfotelmatobacter sp.]|nr:ATP-binding protein [Candidatus Sulfotelmatobacter sp.]
SDRFKIQCICAAPSRRLQCDMTAATHLYRIAQEAVNNALKHSGAQAISIRLTEPDGGIELAISDNGRGLPDAPARGAGMGLHIMDYRARSIGGKLLVRGGSKGTVVSCRLPHQGRRI